MTGSALSEFQASLSSDAAHDSGSLEMYTSTTGGAIAGISTGLTGGYDTPSTSIQSGANPTTEGQADSASTFFIYHNTLPLFLAVITALMGAMIVFLDIDGISSLFSSLCNLKPHTQRVIKISTYFRSWPFHPDRGTD